MHSFFHTLWITFLGSSHSFAPTLQGMAAHAMLTSKFPPSFNLFESQELTSDISLMLCHGWSTSEISASFEDEMGDPDDWEAIHGDAPMPDLPAVIEDVRSEYARLVTGPSKDAERIASLKQALADRDLSFSFDEGWDKGEAAEEGADKADNAGHRGYAYCTNQDVDRLIHEGELYFGFSSMDNPGSDADAEIGEALVDALKEVGLSPQWEGTANARVLCSGLVFELALKED